MIDGAGLSFLPLDTGPGSKADSLRVRYPTVGRTLRDEMHRLCRASARGEFRIVLKVWLSGASALALFAGIACYLAPLQPSILALQLAFSPRAFAEVIHAWSADDLLRYRAHLPYDFLLLACYGSFGYLLAARSALFAARPAAFRTGAMWLLPLAAAFDATGNAFHWWLTEVPRFGIAWAYGVSAACATGKWLLLLAYMIAVLYALDASED